MLSGVILAGGRNRRMEGQNKALLSFHGETILERQLRVMRSVCHEVLIVTHEPEVYKPWRNQARIVREVAPQIGPLGGLVHGLAASEGERVWVLACDIPFPSAQGAVRMSELMEAEKWEAVIPWIAGRHQMLHGVYERSCLPSVETHIREVQKHRMIDLLDRLKWCKVDEAIWQSWGIKPLFAMDVDTPEQYHLALQETQKKST